jgi:hypothetical protein
MTIKQQGGIFGRNPTFNNVTTDGAVTFQGSNNPTVTFSGDANNQNTNPYGSIEFYNADGSAAGPNIAAAIKVLARNGVGSGGEIALFTSDGTQGEGVAAPETIRIDGLGNIVIKNSGSGIDFSATSGTGTSELFDDYEEGTFTPTVSDAASGGNNATIYSTRTGYYTKVGRLVTATITVTNIDTTPLTAGNDVFITGLPFAVSSQSNYIGSCMASDVTFSGMVVARAMSGQTHVKIAENTSGASLDYIVVSELTSGAADIILTVTYEV